MTLLRNAQFRLLLGLFAFGLLLAGAPAALGEPCCTITAINGQTGAVTARVNATGQLFQFKLNNRAQLGQLKLGQPIYANLPAKQVSLDGTKIAGLILSAAPIDGNRATGVLPPKGIRN